MPNVRATNRPEPINLRCWTELTAAVELPADVAVALSCGRAELLRLVPDRACTPAEFRQLLDLIRVLMDTNRALQEHSRDVAEEVEHATQLVKGLGNKLQFTRDLAAFRATTEDAETDD